MAWTIEAAVESGVFQDVIVSTDSLTYGEIARKYGAWVPFTRPESISSDCDTGLVAAHCLGWIDNYCRSLNKPLLTDAVAILQPTSPFRSVDDIKNAVRRYEDLHCSFDSLVSVMKVTQHPTWMFTGSWERDDVVPELKSWLGIPTRFLAGIIAQDLPDLYFPNGAIYISSRNLVEKGRIFGEIIAPYIMPPERSVDIETEWDLRFAETMLNMKEENQK